MYEPHAKPSGADTLRTCSLQGLLEGKRMPPVQEERQDAAALRSHPRPCRQIRSY